MNYIVQDTAHLTTFGVSGIKPIISWTDYLSRPKGICFGFDKLLAKDFRWSVRYLLRFGYFTVFDLTNPTYVPRLKELIDVNLQ